MTGDKLEMNRVESPHDNYEALDRSLVRQTARAAGESAEIVSGDFSDTSYSASKLAVAHPHRTAMRRRRQIAQRIYHLIFTAWLEEAIERGLIQNPSVVPFWKDRKAYTNAKWRGIGMIQADEKKWVEAKLLAIAGGIETYENVLAETGVDLEDFIEQRRAEKKMFEVAGLAYAPSTSEARSISSGSLSARVEALEEMK